MKAIILIKYLARGNGKSPVAFIRKAGQVAYVYGVKKQALLSGKLPSRCTQESGIVWCPNLYEAMLAWSRHQQERRDVVRQERAKSQSCKTDQATKSSVA